jgi:hypothetical protein
MIPGEARMLRGGGLNLVQDIEVIHHLDDGPKTPSISA